MTKNCDKQLKTLKRLLNEATLVLVEGNVIIDTSRGEEVFRLLGDIAYHGNREALH
jgi:hypothetical protein